MILRRRDLGVLLLCSLAVMWSFRGVGLEGGGYYLQESWTLAMDSAHFSTHTPTNAEKLPNPIITDLDGDGLNEIVVVTHDYKIMVLDGGSFGAIGTGGMPTVRTKAEATLVTTAGVRSGRRPVGLGTGFLHPIQPTQHTRQQVIVVVTAGWTVLCFNSNLKLLWESTPVDEIAHGAYHEEVAVLVAPYPIRVGDLGVVVVGGRLASDEKASNINHEHAETDESEEEEMESDHHFSYYAFDGKTGAIRWKHEAADFYSADLHMGEKLDEENLMPQHSYKQHVFSQVKHLGEVDWRQYKGNILDRLPHRYVDKFDASFILDRFVKKLTTGGRSGIAWASEVTGAQQSTPNEVSDKPNVVVAKLKTGLEVVHLYTGRPLCRLLLQSVHTGYTHGAHADINRDGVIDQVRAVIDATDEGAPSCYALALTGVPAVDQLWNGTICGAGLGSGAPALEFLLSKSLQSFSVGSAGIDFKKIRAATPIFARSTTSSGLNSVFYVSTGHLTCYGPTGRHVWQADTPAWWSATDSYPILAVLQIEALDASNNYEHILAVGDEHMVLLSSVDGTVIANHQLRDKNKFSGDTNGRTNIFFTNPPTIGDFNNDGLSDIILLANNGLYGYAIQKGTGSVLFPIIVLALMGVMAYLLVQTDHSNLVDNQPYSRRAKKRATD